MNKIIALAISILIAVTSSTLIAAEKAPQKVVDLAYSTLVSLGSDSIIVKAVRDENARGKTIAGVKALDKTWKAIPGVVDFMKALMVSDCGKHLRHIQDSSPHYAEIFVMDNLGGNVCMTDKTSDYWQGDEDKFIESYNHGNGAVHISDVKFDDSTQAYIVQVSVPVKDNSKVIGAITIGIDVDKME